MRVTAFRALLVAVTFPLFLAGCQDQKFTATIVNPLNLKLPFLPYQKPVRIGIAHESAGIFDPATWDVARVGCPWTPLASRLQRHLRLPVQFEDLAPFQVAAHLQSGRIDFAFLSAEDYVELTDEFGPLGKVIAVSVVRKRQGLIVTRVGSNIETLADIRGRRFAFGPMRDPVLNDATKAALETGGVPLDRIQRELLPVPGAFQHHISSNECAFEIVYGLGTDAGVIEKSEYDAYPDTGGNVLLRRFSKANFRVLGETAPVRVQTIEEGPFIASLEADAAVVEDVRAFLMAAASRHKSAMDAMGLAAFREPAEDVEEQLRELATDDESQLARGLQSSCH
jgi:hypothetical protein